jgi:hypothetical protein
MPSGFPLICVQIVFTNISPAGAFNNQPVICESVATNVPPFGVNVDLCANRIYKHIARWGFQQSTCNLRICGNKHVTPSGFAGKKNSSRMGLLF